MTSLAYWQDRKENALRNLAKPAVIYPNGRSSHDVENEILDEAEDKLIEFLGLTMDARGNWALAYLADE